MGQYRSPEEGHLVQLGGEGKVLGGLLEEATCESRNSYAWCLLWDSPEARAGAPLFPDPEAAGPHCTLGPLSPVWAGLVLAAPALPPAGDTGTPPTQAPWPSPPWTKSFRSTQHPRIKGSECSQPPPITLSEPCTWAASEPRTLSKVMHCSCEQDRSQQGHSHLHTHPSPAHIYLTLHRPRPK